MRTVTFGGVQHSGIRIAMGPVLKRVKSSEMREALAALPGPSVEETRRQQARVMAEAGATLKSIAETFEVSRATVHAWTSEEGS